jgi:hypothetical protein
VVIQADEDSEVQYQRDDGRLVSDSMKLVTRARITETDTPRAANPPDRIIAHRLPHIGEEKFERGEWWVYISLLVLPYPPLCLWKVTMGFRLLLP